MDAIGGAAADAIVDCMDFRIRKQQNHVRPDWVDDRDTLFLTLCHKHRGSSHFRSAAAWDALVFGAEHMKAVGKWKPLLLLAMPDHLHALVRIPREHDIAQTIGSFKRAVSHIHPTNWQGAGFEHRLRGQDQYMAKRAYILMNPVRAGYVVHPYQWPCRKSWEPRGI